MSTQGMSLEVSTFSWQMTKFLERGDGQHVYQKDSATCNIALIYSNLYGQS
jgi:hypothetical protein